MALASLIQLIAACVGIVGSLFFAVGVIRQNSDVMARLSSTCFDSNPHMPAALASQRAEYILGGGLVVTAFVLQFLSFFSTDPTAVLNKHFSRAAPWIAVGGTFILFGLGRFLSKRLAKHFEGQVQEILRRRVEENERAVKEQQGARERAI